MGGDYELLSANSAEEAQDLIRARDPESVDAIEVVASDQQLPNLSGVPFLQWVQDMSPRTVRVLMTGLSNIDEAVEAVNSGVAQQFLFKPWRPEQLIAVFRRAARNFLLERSHEQLLDQLREVNAELEQRVRDRTEKLEEANRALSSRNQILQRMALSDPLTSLANRRAMDRLGRNELIRRSRTPAPLTLGLLDADHFKRINTQYLLSGGDHVLIWLSQTLLNSVRTIDSVGRVGGEEFMIVAPETDAEGAMVLGERIRTTIEKAETTFNGELIRMTVSIGLAVLESGGVGELRADAARGGAGAGRGEGDGAEQVRRACREAGGGGVAALDS